MARLQVPFNNLRRQPQLDAALLAAMEEVLKSGWYINGQQTEAFEAAYAEAIGAQHAVAVSSGQAALTLSLRALGIGAGHEVIVPANTCMASVTAILEAGATPVFAEPDPVYYTLEADEVNPRITSRTKAVMPVHLYGQPCDMTAIMDLADEQRLLVIEDNAQAHFAQWRGQTTGSFGQAAGHSFYPTKNLGAMGDAGAITTNDAALAAQMRSLRDYGREGADYEYVNPGYNARISEVQAAILRVKLQARHEPLPMGLSRSEAASRYRQLLSGLPLQLPQGRPGAVHAWHLFVVLLPDQARRDGLQAWLKQCGIGSQVHYPLPCHRHRRVAHLPQAQVSLPITEDLARRCLSLPLFDGITEEELAAVAQAVTDFMQR